MFQELPFAEEADGAHAEAEDGGHERGGGEEGGGVQDCAVAAEGGCEVDFLGEGGCGGGSIDGEGEVRVEGGGGGGLEDQGDGGVGGVDVSGGLGLELGFGNSGTGLLGEFDKGFSGGGGVVLLDKENVSWRRWPLKRE